MKNSTISWAFMTRVLGVAALASAINVALAWAGRVASHPPTTFGPYMFSSILGLTVGGVLAAGVVYALLSWWCNDASRANRYFVALSAVVLLVSFYPDVMMPWSTDADQVGWTYGIIVNLMLMHVLTAALVLGVFTKKRLS